MKWVKNVLLSAALIGTMGLGTEYLQHQTKIDNSIEQIIVQREEEQRVSALFDQVHDERTGFFVSTLDYETLLADHTLEDVLFLATLQTDTESYVFTTPTEITWYLNEGGTPKEAYTLLQVKDAMGDQWYNTGYDMRYHLVSNVPVDKIKQLATIQSANGHAVFDMTTATRFIEKGRDVNTAQALGKITRNGNLFITDPKVYELLCQRTDVVDSIQTAAELRVENEYFFTTQYSALTFALSNTSVEDLQSLLDVKTVEGERIFTSSSAVTEYFSEGGTVSFAEQLATIEQEPGVSFFAGSDAYITLAAERAAVADVAALVKKRAMDQEFIITSPAFAVYCIDHGYDVPHIEKLEQLTTLSQFPVFWRAQWLRDYLMNDGTVAYAESLLQIPTVYNTSVFHDDFSIFRFHQAHGTLAEAVAFTNIKVDGNRVLQNGQDIARFKTAGADVDEAALWLSTKKNGTLLYNSFTASRAYQLGLPRKNPFSFVDTKKPNAIIAYTVTDHNGAFENQQALALDKRIRKTYDVYTVFGYSEADIYTALMLVPNIKFLKLDGHGNKKTLTLAEKTFSLWEEAELDRQDSELGTYLSYLDDDAVIFLNSCSTAEGGKDEPNLANFVIAQAGRRTVIASTEDFCSTEVQVIELYPFETDIVQQGTGKSLRYSNRTLESFFDRTINLFKFF